MLRATLRAGSGAVCAPELQRWTLSRCCLGTTALERATIGSPLGLPMVSPLWHNGSQLLEDLRRFPRQAQKSWIPCQFYPLEERLNEQEARRCRRRGRACRPAGCASENRERHTVRPAEYDVRHGHRQAGWRVESECVAAELPLVATRRSRHGIAGRWP